MKPPKPLRRMRCSKCNTLTPVERNAAGVKQASCACGCVTVISGGSRWKVSKPEARTHDGIVFDSALEMKRYIELREMEMFGDVVSIRRQVKFPLTVNEIPIGNYTADFVYDRKDADGVFRRVVEDVKNKRTVDYQLRKKLMYACWHIVLEEWPARVIRRKK